ncbi:hypothetical protein M0R45_037173 [Rubus argutus]|uniref:RRM domain-containing protein n=1 Tax=Rubus argutus TaxID=59490 RepID=A0AAW1VZV9_RUBAR
MPRHDDRHGGTRLYVGRLSSRTRSRELEDVFSRYGRVRDVDMKRDFAFVEFSDPRDADDARYSLNGRDVDGSRLIVEFARGAPRGPGGSLLSLWERGHIERNCQNSPKKTSSKRGRSHSRSPSPRRGRSRSRSYSRGHSYSQSRSPVRRERSLERRSRSPADSRSPKRRRASPPPSKGRKRDQSPMGEAHKSEGSLSPQDRRSDYSRSPRERVESPIDDVKRTTMGIRCKRSPVEENGRSDSPSPVVGVTGALLKRMK